jgi:hypothetical protein
MGSEVMILWNLRDDMDITVSYIPVAVLMHMAYVVDDYRLSIPIHYTPVNILPGVTDTRIGFRY